MYLPHMLRHHIATFSVATLALLGVNSAQGQSEENASLYSFKALADLTATSVKDQCRTGTCWVLDHQLS